MDSELDQFDQIDLSEHTHIYMQWYYTWAEAGMIYLHVCVSLYGLDTVYFHAYALIYQSINQYW